jgi:hypothetical protein
MANGRDDARGRREITDRGRGATLSSPPSSLSSSLSSPPIGRRIAWGLSHYLARCASSAAGGEGGEFDPSRAWDCWRATARGGSRRVNRLRRQKQGAGGVLYVFAMPRQKPADTNLHEVLPHLGHGNYVLMFGLCYSTKVVFPKIS